MAQLSWEEMHAHESRLLPLDCMQEECSEPQLVLGSALFRLVRSVALGRLSCCWLRPLWGQ